MVSRFDRYWVDYSMEEFGPLFQAPWYLARNPDVAAAGAEPLAHYIQYGAAEGRNPNPIFDRAGIFPRIRMSRRRGSILWPTTWFRGRRKGGIPTRYLILTGTCLRTRRCPAPASIPWRISSPRELGKVARRTQASISTGLAQIAPSYRSFYRILRACRGGKRR